MPQPKKPALSTSQSAGTQLAMSIYQPTTRWLTPVYCETGRRPATPQKPVNASSRHAPGRQPDTGKRASREQERDRVTRPRRADAVLLELRRYIDRGYWRVAIRRFLWMRAQGMDVPVGDAKRCNEFIGRCSAAELERMHHSIRRVDSDGEVQYRSST
jgi:hypothetical protein